MNKMFIFFIAMIVGATGLSEIAMYQEEPEFQEDITFSIENLNNLKYKIDIDCGWVNDHLDNDTVTFDEEIAVLCQRYFPNATGLDASVEVDE